MQQRALTGICALIAAGGTLTSGCFVITVQSGSDDIKHDDSTSESKMSVTVNGREMMSDRTSFEKIEEKTIPASALRAMELRESFGGVTVRASNADEIRLTAKKSLSSGKRSHDELAKYASLVTIQTETQADKLHVEAQKSKDFPTDISVGVSYEVLVPRRLDLDLHSDNGAITIEGAGRDVRAKSSFGAITISGVTGDIDAGSDNGAVKAENAKNAKIIKLHSSFGAIEIAHATGAIEAKTDNGGITVRDVTVSDHLTLTSSFGAVHATDVKAAGASLNVTMKSDNGAVNFSGDASEFKLASSFGGVEGTLTDHLPFRSGEATSDNGGVTMNLPARFAGTVDAHTDNGAITTSGFTVAQKANGGFEKHLSAVLNNGTAPLTLRSGFGSITLRSQ